MSCNSAEELFDRLLTGALPGTQHERVVTHVDRCSRCRGVLEELRAVEALLDAPRRVELAANFTFATMAEVRALHPPRRFHAPIRAYLVSYVAGAWLIAGAASILAPQSMHALVGTTLDLARSIADAIGGLGTVIGRLFGRGGNVLGALLGGLLGLDAILVAGCSIALRYVRPRLVERSRS